MYEKTIDCNFVDGLEMKTIAHFIQKASDFDASIYIHTREQRANAKSLLGMMSLPLADAEEVTLRAEGQDAEKAVEALAAFLLKPEV